MTEANLTEKRAQLVFVGHGGGPLPLLGDPGHQAMVDFMTRLPARLNPPEAIVVISAHWEESAATLLGAAHPALLYDYFGFPEEAYRVTYPAPGSPELAARMAGYLNQQHIPARLDTQRGLDHGVFVPLKLMYPQANIPVVQLSLLRGLNAAAHLALGQALRALLPEPVLVMGSGFSFHNTRAFFGKGMGAPDPANDAFQNWLIETCTGPLTPAERHQRLLEWEKAPAARYCHPREEHLLPLQVCFGMAGGGPAQLIFDDLIVGKRAVAFLW